MSIHKVTASLVNDGAFVRANDTTFTVSRRDDGKQAGSCPIDYLSGALGS
jgi:hypothetical protein